MGSSKLSAVWYYPKHPPTPTHTTSDHATQCMYRIITFGFCAKGGKQRLLAIFWRVCHTFSVMNPVKKLFNTSNQDLLLSGVPYLYCAMSFNVCSHHWSLQVSLYRDRHQLSPSLNTLFFFISTYISAVCVQLSRYLLIVASW